jgi:O-succinylbenzoate synthase
VGRADGARRDARARDALNPLLASTAKLELAFCALLRWARSVKIRAARVTCFRLPLLAPLATAHGAIGARDGALLEVATRSGLRGFGEAMPLPGFGLESFEESQRALAAIARVLLGCDVRERDAALARVQQAAPCAPAARAAADCALHDLAAREAVVSLASLLAGGKAVRTSVRANALVAEGESGAAALAAQRLAAAGYDTLKLKVGVDLERDLRRIAAVRAALPAAMRLRLDANGAFGSRGGAARASRASTRSSSSSRSRRTTRGAGRACARHRPCRLQPTNRCATKRRRGRCSKPAPSIGWC